MRIHSYVTIINICITGFPFAFNLGMTSFYFVIPHQWY